VTGNIYASNAVTTTNVVASGTISYSYDLVAQGAYLNPTTANSSTIIQWYQRLVTTTGQPFWSLNSSPQLGALSPLGVIGYNTTTLLNDGRVLFNQLGTGNNIGFFTPERNQFSSVSGGFTIGTYDYTGSIQIPDGRVIFIPSNGNKIGALNPITYSFTTYSTGTSINNMHYGAVYEPSGNVIMTPTTTSNVGIFNTGTNSYSRISFPSDVAQSVTPLYYGSVLLTDGRVLFVPNNTSNIGIYTPTTATYTNVTVTVSGSYAGGCLMPSGNVFMAPYNNSSNAIIYNPFLNTQSNVNGLNGNFLGGAASGCASLPDGRIVIFTAHNINFGSMVIYNSVTGAFNQVSGTSSISFQNATIPAGGTLIPDGRIIFAGSSTYGAYALDTRTPAPREFCLHPFFNKF
jgi:streptogramin lyase